MAEAIFNHHVRLIVASAWRLHDNLEGVSERSRDPENVLDRLDETQRAGARERVAAFVNDRRSRQQHLPPRSALGTRLMELQAVVIEKYSSGESKVDAFDIVRGRTVFEEARAYVQELFPDVEEPATRENVAVISRRSGRPRWRVLGEVVSVADLDRVASATQRRDQVVRAVHLSAQVPSAGQHPPLADLTGRFVKATETPCASRTRPDSGVLRREVSHDHHHAVSGSRRDRRPRPGP